MLTERLDEKGIQVKDEPGVIWSEHDSRKSTTLLEIQSPPLTEIVDQLDKKSINLYAEALLLHLSRENGLSVSVENGCKALTEFWSSKGMDTTGLFLQDASGLSRANGISPAQLGFVLKYMNNESAEKEAFAASLPASGISGSLKSFAPELPGKFRAKSGYMSRVLNYAGYLETTSGKNLIVVLMVNNYTCTTSEMRELWERLVEEVYETN
jgi:D-alanyl-D-alanine carboxypeptidase/D-alanyl-D-alanine-endopeptidase (penicillin-binding protein 4)